MTDRELIHMFRVKKAYRKGHFKLSSGLHSDGYLQCAMVLQYPEFCEKSAKALADFFSDEKIDAVIGPALGGVTLAYEVARQLGVRGIFAEREKDRMTLRRGFSINRDERILIVEDVITTGASAREVADLVKACGAKPVAVGCIVDRSDGMFSFEGTFHSLTQFSIKTYPQENCPFCKKGQAIVRPGSRGGA